MYVDCDGAALPTIIRDLEGTRFIWAGSAYALGSTSLVPFCGGLTQVLLYVFSGEKSWFNVIVIRSLVGDHHALALFLFALGKVRCPSSSSPARRAAVQGLGAGDIAATGQIVLSDLVTLRERGTFSGIMSLWVTFFRFVRSTLPNGPYAAFGLSAVVQVRSLEDRWLRAGTGISFPSPLLSASCLSPDRFSLQEMAFYLNPPICTFNVILVLLFMRLKTPPATLSEKLSKIDFMVNNLGRNGAYLGRYTIFVVHRFGPRASVIGIVGLTSFVIYEFHFCKPPTVPILFDLNWTGTSGYLQNFVMAVVLASLSYWYVVFFEACKDKSPSGAGVDFFGFSYTCSAIAILVGIAVGKRGKYMIPTYIGWALMVSGTALLTTLRADSSMAKSIGFQLVIGSGVGTIVVASLFPILASVPVTQTAPAMTLCVFVRNFGYIWGITIGGAILQNELKNKLPSSFLAQFPQGAELAFATIPLIPMLEQPLKDEVRRTFGEALKVVWQVMLGIASAGFLSSLGMRQLPLHTNIDQTWGREDIPVSTERVLSLGLEMSLGNSDKNGGNIGGSQA
ncbi:hypothetical protein EI94DRAFT_1814313 [Lactarius quietus]|nr:hypothetical protein EI94DRAFT_1814313 [Lactarius quietus]